MSYSYYDEINALLGNGGRGDKTVGENQLRLPGGRVITFNDEQAEGLGKIRRWLEGGEQFFTLAGYAGTGKSTLVKKVLDTYTGSVVVSAPTHKAKKVITSTTGKAGQTLQSLLGLRPDVTLDDFNPNDPKFNPIAPPKISKYGLVVIDEASMINRELYDLIRTSIRNQRTKVLYMGDPAQIPPIGEKESAVFSDMGIGHHWLTTVERQSGTNPLARVYDALRNNLDRPDGGVPEGIPR